MSKDKNIHIRVGVGPNRDNDPDDILQLKNILAALSYYDVPDYGITPYPDKETFFAIKQFQKDTGLKVDGIVKPNGETVRTLDKTMAMGVRSPRMECQECHGFNGGACSRFYCCSCNTKLGLPNDTFDRRSF